MTVRCRCGLIITAELDAILDDQREARLQQRLADQMAKHIGRFHQQEMQAGVRFAGELMAFCVFAQFDSDDPKFHAWREEGRSRLAALFAPPGEPLAPNAAAGKVHQA